MAILTSQTTRRLGLIMASVILLAVVCSWLVLYASRPERHCAKMIAKLNKAVASEALEQATAGLVKKRAAVRAQRLTREELPQPILKAMDVLGLAEASVVGDSRKDRSFVCLYSPGGFASYGMRIAPTGVALPPSTATHGLTEMRWKDGIYVFYFTP